MDLELTLCLADFWSCMRHGKIVQLGKEECGIDIRNLRHVGTTNNIMRDENRHTITVFMQGEVPEEEVPQNLEPDKCEGWSWVTWDKLRTSQPLFLPLRLLVESGFVPPRV
mmetsp:Transcript_45320/g.73812  ORF Transcript_45320/g.73812 Transcript_45320/m.73812 type:complete len:111 (+) Transcript_45320:137-469(+)